MLRYIAHAISLEFGEAPRTAENPNTKKATPKPNAKDWIASKTIKKTSCPAVGWAPPSAMGHKIGPKAIAATPTTTVTNVTLTQVFTTLPPFYRCPQQIVSYVSIISSPRGNIRAEAP
jgi:hypothetical protein